MESIPGIEHFEKINIKEQNISPEDLDRAAAFAGSYQSVFSKRAMKYRKQGLHLKSLSEDDYRKLILAEYTFLKRPVFLVDNDIYIGNSKKVVERLIEDINGKFSRA